MKADKQKVKSKIAHAWAGFSVGLVIYALYLFTLPMFFGVGLSNGVYWVMPIPFQNDSYSPFTRFITNLSLAWDFHRIDLLAVLLGLSTPLFFALWACWLERKRPVAWLRRWYIQFVFAGVGLTALLFIADSITFILRL